MEKSIHYVRRNGEVANHHSRYIRYLLGYFMTPNRVHTRWNTYFIYGRTREREQKKIEYHIKGMHHLV